MKKIIVFCLILMLAVGSVQGQEEHALYDPEQEGILSGYYPIDPQTGFLTDVGCGTSPEQLTQACLPRDLRFSGDVVGTGARLENDRLSVTVIVTGDASGDGEISITDLLMTKSSILGTQLTDVQLAAADVTADGEVTITDFLRIKSHILGQSAITPQNRGGNTPMTLMTPGQTAAWLPGCVSGDEAVVTIDENGNIRAVAEGSAFVYAYEEEQLVGRTLVTVVSQPPALSLGIESLQLVKSRTHTLYARLNHPVDMPVTWESSDPAVATVENGLVTGMKFGTAVITASLENGSRAQVDVTVIPAVTAMDVERTLYKVKPNAQKQLAVCTEPADGQEQILWSTSDPSIATVDENGVVTGHKYGTVTVTATGKYSGLTATCKVKVCNVKQVAFTFDDGPSPQTTKLLNFLKENDIRVTFFVVGNRMKTYESIIKREVAEGHEIGYHSYDHQNQTRLSDDTIKAHYEKSAALLREMTGAEFTAWRTPGGNHNPRVTGCVELPHILWWIDSRDWVTRNSSAVYRAVRNSPDGSIVLMHDLYSFTVNGAIQAMREMQAGDYEFLTVTELLSRDGTPPENGETYKRG